MSTDSDMVQCEVTGNWIPADEVVTFQGKRVGAEGKAILLERLRTGSGVPGEMVRSTVIARFGGMFVDGILIGIVALILFMMAGFVVTSSVQSGKGAASLPYFFLIQGLAQGLFAGFVLWYFTSYHSQSGQTPGKKAAGTKVVMLDGSALTSGVAFRRVMYLYFPNVIVSLLYILFAISLMFRTDASRVEPLGVLPIAIAIMSFFGSIYFVLSALFALFDSSRQRAIHDRLAGTRVIRVS